MFKNCWWQWKNNYEYAFVKENTVIAKFILLLDLNSDFKITE